MEIVLSVRGTAGYLLNGEINIAVCVAAVLFKQYLKKELVRNFFIFHHQCMVLLSGLNLT